MNPAPTLDDFRDCAKARHALIKQVEYLRKHIHDTEHHEDRQLATCAKCASINRLMKGATSA